MVSNSKNRNELCTCGEGGTEFFFRKKNRMIKRPIKYTIKNNNVANYIERFNIPTVLAMFMLCSQHLMIHAT
jgi:hypothetical protein